MKKGIIFDLDGTLWDSSEQVAYAWSCVLTRHGRAGITVSDMRGYMGKTLDDISLLMLPDLDKEERGRLMAECCEEEHRYLMTHCGILYPKLFETLEALGRKYELFIVSNCQSGYIECFFAGSGAEEYFRDTECPGGSGLLKSGNIRLIAERNALDCAVYVGDTQGDADASEAAGVPFIHAAYGFGSVRKAAARINSLSELESVVDRLL